MESDFFSLPAFSRAIECRDAVTLTRLLQLRWHHKAFDELTTLALLDHAGFECKEVSPFTNLAPRMTSRGYLAVKSNGGQERNRARDWTTAI